MGLLVKEIIMTEEEYIQFELQSETRHEYVNGKLIEMPGESITNNRVALAIAFLFMKHFESAGYHCYMEGIKLKIPDESKYFYPDVMITKEAEAEGNEYIRYKPEIIVEVLSKSTRKYDAVDKFINYQKFDSLQYYLLIEPDFPLVTQYSRSTEGDWEMESFTDKNREVPLPLYNFTLPLIDIYEQ